MNAWYDVHTDVNIQSINDFFEAVAIACIMERENVHTYRCFLDKFVLIKSNFIIIQNGKR